MCVYSNHLQAIKQVQELRVKKASALQLGESDLHITLSTAGGGPLSSMGSSAAAASAGSAGSAVPAIGKEFGGETKDTQALLIEEQMEKYIADQLAARRALRQPQKESTHAAAASAASIAEGTAAKPALNLSEDQLFITPAHLQLQAPSTSEAEESGERWLTGLSEQSLSMKDKMKNIERTERARVEFMAKESARKSAEAGLILPANYNSNFKLHKKEWDGRRRDEVRSFIDLQNRSQAVAQGLPIPAPVSRERTTNLVHQSNALPGFLAGGVEEHREELRRMAYQSGGARGPASANAPPGVRGSGMASASDERVVDRFIKKFKYK